MLNYAAIYTNPSYGFAIGGYAHIITIVLVDETTVHNSVYMCVYIYTHTYKYVSILWE